MKRILLQALLCSAALGLCAATPEEERWIVRESVEWMFGDPITPKKWKRWQREIKPALDALPKDIRMSEHCGILAEKMDDLAFVNHIISEFLDDDGLDVASAGNAEALALTRKVLKIYDGKPHFRDWIAHRYLALKGNEGDLGLLRKSTRIGLVDIECLEQRIAGTNVTHHLVHVKKNMMLEDRFSVVPSVANTGPQGAYVEAILRQCLEQLVVELYQGDYRKFRFNDKFKIPAELQTMVVWFDGDGNPACSVDLGKYGLSMPTLNVPAQGRMTLSPWLYAGCIPCLLAVLLWAKARRIAWSAARALRRLLPYVLRCAVFAVVAWVCCWLSAMLWSWTVNEHMETDGPYYYSGFPIWFAITAAHGTVGGAAYIPIRLSLNTAVWLIFWLFVRELLTGRIIEPIPARLIPIRRRIVFGLLMIALFYGFYILMMHFFFYQRWLCWCTLAVTPALIVVSLKWLRTGHVFAKRTDCNRIPWRRWLTFFAGVVFIILISICFNKTLPTQSTTGNLPLFYLLFYPLFYLLF